MDKWTSSILTYSTMGAPVQLSLPQLTNYLGIGMLNLPYALRLTGWRGLPSIPLVTLLYTSTALMLDRCLEYLPPTWPKTLPSLTHHVYGLTGRYVALLSAQIDLFGGTCAGLAMAWA